LSLTEFCPGFKWDSCWNKFDNWDSGACIGQQIRKVCRCQTGYRKSSIEEGQAMQWPNENGQNDKQWSTKTIWITISVMLRKISGICIKPSVLYNKKKET
jgi:hypothetical protein